MGNPLIRMNPTHASMTPMKAGGGMKPPGEQLERGLGGAHFTNPTYIQQGHNTNGKMKAGAARRKGKSNTGRGGQYTSKGAK